MKASKKEKRSRFMDFFRKKSFQQALVAVLTTLISAVIVVDGSIPKKYKLSVGEKSDYDITAPREIYNVLLTEKLAEEAAGKVPPVMVRLENVTIDIINTANDLINDVKEARQGIDKNLREQGINADSEEYESVLEMERANAMDWLDTRFQGYGIFLTGEQVDYLVNGADDEQLDQFAEITKTLISTVMKQEVTEENIADKIESVRYSFQSSSLPPELKNIGSLISAVLLKPNSVIDTAMTEEKKAEAYNIAMKENRQIIPEGSRILSVGDIVTEDRLEVLRELNLLETGKFDFAFTGGILAIVLLLAVLLCLYLRFFFTRYLQGIKEIILLCVIIILTLAAAWLINPLKTLLIPIFIAPMLISILLDLRMGIVVNFLLAMAISLITKGDTVFMYTAVIGGSISAYIVSGATQRSRLSASGLAVAVINALIATSIALINKSGLSTIANNAAMVALNGILSTIFTIGALPFFESTFNIITPLKLLELANPNHPLMKKLLMEAPGTYHHSLMVGNLAEVAIEAINGNALLARVGAYYHDVGKLKRPNFFKENQLSDNPHDKMSPNLSSLVITSHTSDGVELAEKYKIPLAVRNIISQHHGTTLVAYFYYKAKKNDKNDSVKLDDFRYQGPRPTTREAAVVMLADSVEAAVRSMADKTEGKIEGLIRSIIKDRLDDGQLDLCDLTLKDLDLMAKAFVRVFGGYFHEREEYPEIKAGQIQQQLMESSEEPVTVTIPDNYQEQGESLAEISGEERRVYHERAQN
ncbi:MAG: HD family phosphohydrolase [Acetivibrionales bacterium]